MDTIEFKKLHPDAIIPYRATPESAGFDLYALVDTDITQGSVIVPTGIAVKLPRGTYGRIAMRSGLAVKSHLAVSAGVIDRDYRGAIGVVTFATQPGHVHIRAGDRFAQIIIEKCSYADPIEVSEFSTDDMKSHNGFGSTGQ